MKSIHIVSILLCGVRPAACTRTLIFYVLTIQIFAPAEQLQKITLRAQAWVVVAGRGLTVLLATLCMFFWGSTAIKPLLTVTAISCFVMVMFELCVAWKLASGNGEMVDERDRVLLSRAADKAITISQMLIGVMAIVFLALAFKEKAFIEGGIMFALIGINLPSLLKYAFFLYLEATDEGEYFE